MAGLFDKQPSLRFNQRITKFDRQHALNGTPAQKYAFMENVAINVDSFQNARDFIDALLMRTTRAKRPGGLWIVGEGGVGKSFILADLINRYPQMDTDVARITPVLGISFEERPSVSSILIELLIQLGQDPQLIHYRRNADLQRMLIDALPSCGTMAIFFDEAQHLWLTARSRKSLDRKGGALGDFIKQLYDKTHVAFIFCGTPGLTEIFKEDSQANTRWSGTLQLKSFNYDSVFIGLLKVLDQAAPLREECGLAKNYAEKLYQSTRGNFRLLKRLLAEAVYIAAMQDADKLSAEHLAEAHFGIFCDQENPFK
ncbi:TniB family NTP-binding protein [Methylophilus sp. 3sh_L]|uniref:TniB family NTP-binding protein n=1 Tax=Methylophilus sp. 3sh_L TaxID=3377114 RepID=UPI00398E7D79